MFKFFKFLAVMSFGMLFAPKKGSELREDFVKYLNKYKPQLKKLILTLDESWEKSKSLESDEVALEMEVKMAEVRNTVAELDAAKTKEIAYKTLQKLGDTSLKIGKGIVKSPNFKALAKDLALMTVNVLDKASNVYSKVKDVSTSLVEDVKEDSATSKSKLIKVEEIKKTEQSELMKRKK